MKTLTEVITQLKKMEERSLGLAHDEKIAGNKAKEEFYTGVVTGIRTALALLNEASYD